MKCCFNRFPCIYILTPSQSYVQGLGLFWRASCSLICRFHWQGHSEVPLLKPINAKWENCPCLVPLHARGHQPCMQTPLADLSERPICHASLVGRKPGLCLVQGATTWKCLEEGCGGSGPPVRLLKGGSAQVQGLFNEELDRHPFSFLAPHNKIVVINQKFEDDKRLRMR